MARMLIGDDELLDEAVSARRILSSDTAFDLHQS